MNRLLVFLALISVNQLAECATQSFASSSIVKPNGQVISSSIYTDSKGNRVVNGQALKVPPLFNDLLPPFAPGELVKPFVLPPIVPFQPIKPLAPLQPIKPLVVPGVKPSVVPVTKPVVPVTAAKTTTRVTPTTRTTTRATTRASLNANRVTSAAKYASNSSLDDKGRYIEENPGAYVHDPTVGAYVHDESAGAYVHDPSVGAWQPDDRGKYRG